MIDIHPQYINDSNGDTSHVVLTSAEFEAILEELEDAEDVRLYDEATKNDDGEHTSLEDYLKSRKAKNA